MAGSQTAWSAENVQKTAQEHDDLADRLQSELTQLEGDIQDTLSQSSSSMTHTLDSTFKEYANEIKKAVLANMHAMADDMRMALGKQQNANDEAGQGVKSKMGTVMGSFLKPAG